MEEGISHGDKILPCNLSTKGEVKEIPNRIHRPLPRGSPPQTHVEDGQGGGGAERRGHENGLIRGANEAVLVRPIQLVIPLEFDQGREDVEDP